MKKFSIFPLVIVSALLSWSTSFAAITYDYSIVPPFNRYIEAEAIVGENMDGLYLEESFSEGPFLEEVYASVGDFSNPDNGFAEANSWQNSNIVASNESLSVAAMGDFNATAIDGESIYTYAYASNGLTVRFTVEDPIYYQLDWLSENAQITLFGNNSGTIFNIFNLGVDSGTKSGNLAPDDYEFFIYTGGEGSEFGEYGGYDVEFSVSNVPLPGGIWLLGTGLIGIIGIRRKLKK